MRRLWLHNIGVFELIPNSGQGSCLFQAISQGLTCSPKFHRKIRHCIVEHMTCPTRVHKVADFPPFWRRKITSNWLEKERAYITEKQDERQRRNNEGRDRLIFIKKLICIGCFSRYALWRRRHRYNRYKKLFQTNNLLGRPSSLKAFKRVFRKFMSCPLEPGTRFELEGAANKFQFHYDFLQALPLNSPNITATTPTQSNLSSKFSEIDILNNNDNKPMNSFELHDKVTTEKNGNICTDEDEDKEKSVKIGKYQFHSCRTVGCDLPRESSVSIDHFYFLHSLIPSPSSLSSEQTEALPEIDSTRHNEFQSGHWELMLPIFLCQEPVPLNRCIFGFTYEITDRDRNFTPTECGGKRETKDTVALAIDSHIQRNPNLIPENSQWPAYDGDDFIGCCTHITPVNGFHRDKGNPNPVPSAQLQHDMVPHSHPHGFWNDTVNENSRRNGLININGDDLNNWDDVNMNDNNNLNNMSKDMDREMMKTQSSMEMKVDDISIRDMVKRWKTCVHLVSHSKARIRPKEK